MGSWDVDYRGTGCMITYMRGDDLKDPDAMTYEVSIFFEELFANGVKGSPYDFHVSLGKGRIIEDQDELQREKEAFIDMVIIFDSSFPDATDEQRKELLTGLEKSFNRGRSK